MRTSIITNVTSDNIVFLVLRKSNAQLLTYTWPNFRSWNDITLDVQMTKILASKLPNQSYAFILHLTTELRLIYHLCTATPPPWYYIYNMTILLLLLTQSPPLGTNYASSPFKVYPGSYLGFSKEGCWSIWTQPGSPGVTHI